MAQKVEPNKMFEKFTYRQFKKMAGGGGGGGTLGPPMDF